MGWGRSVEHLFDAWLHCSLRLRATLIGRIPIRPGLPQSPLTSIRAHQKILGVLSPPSDVRDVVDVGPASWFYLRALCEAFPRANILGIELDPYRRFRDLFRRVDHARAQINYLVDNGSRSIRYVNGDFSDSIWTDRIESDSLITFFFPIVFSGTARQWGLPGSAASWPKQLGVALRLLEINQCSVLIAHVDAQEVRETEKILIGHDLRALWFRAEVPDWGKGVVYVTLLRSKLTLHNIYSQTCKYI